MRQSSQAEFGEAGGRCLDPERRARKAAQAREWYRLIVDAWYCV
jgi:hypothetical protein